MSIPFLIWVYSKVVTFGSRFMIVYIEIYSNKWYAKENKFPPALPEGIYQPCTKIPKFLFVFLYYFRTQIKLFTHNKHCDI